MRLPLRKLRLDRPVGFTLLELLVATVLLIMVSGLLLQLLSGTSRMVQQNRSRFSADTRAQAVLGLIDQEVQDGIIRSDLAAFPGGRVELYTQRRATGGNRPVSLVGYHVDATAGTLQRAAIATSWTPASASQFSFGDTNAFPLLPAYSSTNGIWREVASGIVALRLKFVGRDGSSSDTQFQFDGTNATAGILVTVATIDERTETRLRDANMLTDLVQDSLWGATAPANKTLAQHWTAQVQSNTNQGFTKLRIAERYVPLPH
jgi:type II secretory pathway pseudopilin PulG